MKAESQMDSEIESEDEYSAEDSGGGQGKALPEQRTEKAGGERPGRRPSRSQLLEIVRRLWPFLRPQRRRLALASIISLALTGAEVAVPVLVGLFLDALLARLHGTPATVISGELLLISFAGLAALRGLLLWRFRSVSGQIGERVAARLRDALWKHLQVLPLEYARRRGTGQLLLRFIGDTRAVQRLVTDGLVRLSQELLLGAGVLVALAVINWRMAMVVALILPLYALIFWQLNPALQQASRATRRRRSRLSSYLQERIAGLAVVKAFSRQQTEAQNVGELNKDLARRAAGRAAVDGQLQGLTTFIVGVAAASVLGLAVREVDSHRLTAGGLVSFYALLGLLLPVFRRVVTANRYLQEGQISVDRLINTLAVPPEGEYGVDASSVERRASRASPRPSSLDPRLTLEVAHGEVVAKNVGYALDGDRPILTDVSFRARRGEVVAIVGPNGAGKTTLMELLLRFREPSSGALLIDGRNIAEVSLASLRRQVGLVGSDWPIFDGTVLENIAYGLEEGEASPERIQRAIRLAGASAFIASLPKGAQTRVGRGGGRLSAGQRQLIAWARALVVDPPILLLDDALTGLDAQAEATLVESLNGLAERKTVILAAHRVPARPCPTRVYWLENGRLKEFRREAPVVVESGVGPKR